PGGRPAGLLFGGRVELALVDAVVGDVDPGGVGVQDAHQLVPGRLGRHDDPVGVAHGGAGGGAEEGRFDGAVLLGLGEPGDVVHGHHGRQAGAERDRVVGGVDQV